MKIKKQEVQLKSTDQQAVLNAVPGSLKNDFEEDIWKFKGRYESIIVIDFNEFNYISSRYPNWPLSSTFDWILVTKLVWLSTISINNVGSYARQQNNLMLLWTAMAELNQTQLTRTNCKSMLAFLLMHSWSNGEVSRNLTVKSSVIFSGQIQFQSFRKQLSYLGIDWISPEVTPKLVKKQLKALIPTLTNSELTYRDWQEGGTRDRLSLDYGRYYIEHCLSFFENNYPLAIALTSTMRDIQKISSEININEQMVYRLTSMLLQGYSSIELLNRVSDISIDKIRVVEAAVTERFTATYKESLYEAALLQHKHLDKFVRGLGLESSSENVDRMRTIIWDWNHDNDRSKTETLLAECQNSIKWECFQNQLDAVKKEIYTLPCKIPTKQVYESTGITQSDKEVWINSVTRQFRRLTGEAGLTSIVALTGWRRSEFGFPYSAIKRKTNHDRLDQYACPERYELDWYVFKTHGKIRQRREITFTILTIAKRLQLLHDRTDEQPCLYKVFSTKTDPFKSGERIHNGIRSLWYNFVFYYPAFKLLDDEKTKQTLANNLVTDDSLIEGIQNTQPENHTSCEIADISVDVNLIEAWQRARDEWPRLEIFFHHKKTREKRYLLAKYCANELRPDWTALLDTHLSDETKNWLHSLPLKKLISSRISKVVMNEFMQGTLYPTPHGFRHIWAEAVYRRFDGDAGWMIRSQFQHVAKKMWLDYVRNKDNRHNHLNVKFRVISSLVKNYAKHRGEGYSGQLHIWLRRILKKTSVMLPEEQEYLLRHISSNEIEDIKALPWGYCLLKRRARNQAKCSEMGVPMRHNASPDLCLGCIHNLMQVENVEWSLIHIASHVEALKNPIVPALFKSSSYNLVKNVTKHVRRLNPEHESLSELDTVLLVNK